MKAPTPWVPVAVGVAGGYVLAVVMHAAWAGSTPPNVAPAARRPFVYAAELRNNIELKEPPSLASAAAAATAQQGSRGAEEGRDRLVIVSTMTYEHMYRRPNLARTALQLRAAGYEDLVWIVIEVWTP